ncbi:glycosyltransferase family 4 protein [uncultured Acidaminococcus sp.]|uniref:glycosyltransferase family 4 protein n=1 Tax=uncultured Acidaminococcus sp. TaxID=352152 RepID=UPI00294228D8|nr:glycosyltransferase family 4 protein [uncultured Acidaminococcus sp.]
MGKKDVLFLCQFFYPEHNSSATLPFDTAAYFAEQGLQTGALCGYPKEYTEKVNVPLKETVKSVSIKRIKYMELSRRSVLGRLINYFSFTMGALGNLFYIKDYKVVLVYSNPPVLPCIPIIANLLFHTKIVFVAYDVYPEVAYASKSLQPGSLIDRVMKWINASLYARASMVVALTDEMNKFLLQHRPQLDPSRVCTIANWAHEKKTAPSEEAYHRFGYQEGQFVVSYFGNMGICQDMETLLGAIRRTKENPQIQYLIVGHGSKKEQVSKIVNESPYVKVLDFLVGKDFEQAVSISSVSIVSLEKGLMGTCAPSKYYSYLQGGHPVIAIVEKDSYLAQEVEQEKIGGFVEIGDSDSLADMVTELQKNPEQIAQMGRDAERLYNEKYQMQIGLKKYYNLVQKLLK